MSKMIVQPGGGIAFQRTAEEKRVSNLKKEMEKDRQELKELKKEFKRELEELKKLKRSDADG